MRKRIKIESFIITLYSTYFATTMKKIDVNGDNADPVFKFLKSKTRGLLGSSVKWNFTKFLISRDGKRIERYAPVTTPESLDKKIANLLAE